MSSDDELLASRSDGVLEIVLNRPDQSNALSPLIVEAILDAISGADRIQMAVIRGEGRNFCAGFDLSDLARLTDADLLWRFVRIELMLQAVHHAPFPIVAFAHGHVVGAGADLFAACTHRVADRSARFRMPGWNFELGLGTQRLTNVVGTDAARDLLIGTRSFEIDEAHDLGLVNEIVETADWSEVKVRWLERSSTLSRRAVADLLAVTMDDTRAHDLATVVRTAARAGLKARIEAYRSA